MAMKFKIDRILTIATLASSLVAIVLVLKKPAPVAHSQAPAAVAEHAQAFDEKMAAFQAATQQASANGGNDSSQSDSRYSDGQQSNVQQSGTRRSAGLDAASPKAEVHINSDEISAVLAQSLGMASADGGLSANSNIGSAAPTIKDQQVSFDGDVVHGQFLTEVAGKDVWITVSGHIGEKDGYATFDPTEFKVGDLSIPVALVNPALQKKLADQRDRLKLPDNVGAMKVQNGELVMQQK